MYKYVVFLNDETWIIIDADEYIYNIALKSITFYRNHENMGTFYTDKITGFCMYEKCLLRILKNQKVCNGFEGGLYNETTN